MSQIAIGCKSLPALQAAIFIGAYNFRDAWKSRRIGGKILRQVDQQIAAGRTDGITGADGDRSFGRSLCIGNFVRHETAIPEGPQQFIDAACEALIEGTYVHGIVQPVGFFREAAGKHVASGFAGVGEYVKVDSGHS